MTVKSTKPSMLKIVAERAVFKRARHLRDVDSWLNVTLNDELVVFSIKGGSAKGGVRVSWIITVRGDRYVSYFFRRQKWVRMPDEITQALIVKAWPIWTPSLEK